MTSTTLLFLVIGLGLVAWFFGRLKAGVRDGYLVKAGLIAAPDDVRANIADVVENMTPLAISDLK